MNDKYYLVTFTITIAGYENTLQESVKAESKEEAIKSVLENNLRNDIGGGAEWLDDGVYTDCHCDILLEWSKCIELTKLAYINFNSIVKGLN